MASGAEHYRHAEDALNTASNLPMGSPEEHYALAAAQVHATLAQAAATIEAAYAVATSDQDENIRNDWLEAVQ